MTRSDYMATTRIIANRGTDCLLEPRQSLGFGTDVRLRGGCANHDPRQCGGANRLRIDTPATAGRN